MSTAYQKQYKYDPEFRKKVIERVKELNRVNLEDPLYVRMKYAQKKIWRLQESVISLRDKLKKRQKQLDHWREVNEVCKIEWRAKRTMLVRENSFGTTIQDTRLYAENGKPLDSGSSKIRKPKQIKKIYDTTNNGG